MPRRALLSLLVAGCAPVETPELSLLQFRQHGQAGVLLNETLDFHFSAELDPASVTDESFAVLGPDGRRARGRVEVDGAKLAFLPDLPKEPDLSDGGLVPGRTYTVLLAGFPRPDGLRGRRGELLGRTTRSSFATVARGGERRVFLDPHPDRLSVFVQVPLTSRRIGPLDPILFECDEALHPGSVAAEQFQLFREQPEAGLEPIPVALELVENLPERALLELRPRGESPDVVPALEPGTYLLFEDPKRSDLETVGGRPVRLAIRGVPAQLPHLEIRVVGPQVVTLREELRDVLRRSPEGVADVDGTALWDGAGSIRLRFPAAAGTGRDGEAPLAGTLATRDLHGTRLVVPEGEVCELPAEGLVVLRAQGSFEVRGRLVRRAERSDLARGPEEPFEAWAARARRAPPDAWTVPSMEEDFETPAGTTPLRQDWPTLSAWLAGLCEGAGGPTGPPWTVLVAGGDLRVSGTIQSDGPVLLVAGGWVRVHGRLEVREAWKLREGGGGAGGELSRLRTAPLILDEPAENPLTITLRVAALSSPIRPQPGFVGWRAAVSDVHEGSGSAAVRFLGERGPEQRAEPTAAPAQGVRLFGPVENLALLEGCEAVRFLVRLEMPPGVPWDPPRVETVELSWYESP